MVRPVMCFEWLPEQPPTEDQHSEPVPNLTEKAVVSLDSNESGTVDQTAASVSLEIGENADVGPNLIEGTHTEMQLGESEATGGSTVEDVASADNITQPITAGNGDEGKVPDPPADQHVSPIILDDQADQKTDAESSADPTPMDVDSSEAGPIEAVSDQVAPTTTSGLESSVQSELPPETLPLTDENASKELGEPCTVTERDPISNADAANTPVPTSEAVPVSEQSVREAEEQLARLENRVQQYMSTIIAAGCYACGACAAADMYGNSLARHLVEECATSTATLNPDPALVRARIEAEAQVRAEQERQRQQQAEVSSPIPSTSL